MLDQMHKKRADSWRRSQ